jgi:hypothetical protein
MSRQASRLALLKALQVDAAEGNLSLPVLRNTDLLVLESLFPPRCLKRNETVEDHLRYAAVVEHIQNLRTAYDNATQNDQAAGYDLEDGERAS